MRLKTLQSQITLSTIRGDGETQFQGIAIDSRTVHPGDLFVCIRGLVFDGHQYAKDAELNGAVAVVADRSLDIDVPLLIVNDSREALGMIASLFYRYPSREMKVIGITGTNGKTTMSYLIEHILLDNGFRTGLMGTIEKRIGQRVLSASRTTQEAHELQRNFSEMRKEQTEYCVMEVSSHALALGRVKGTRFRTAVFTNLTQDHLDYHETMEQYREAKGLLFSRLGNGDDPAVKQYAVLNGDDPASAYFRRLTAAEVVTYGFAEGADVRAENIRVAQESTCFDVKTFKGDTSIRLNLIGRFNVYNALGAIAAALLEEVPLTEIKHSIEKMTAVEGRMEQIKQGQNFSVIVDYAHSPDGLENALQTVREFARGRVYCVFGCGGDRDQKKRPIMGKIAAKYSDYTIVTSDNPRSEDPEQIIKQIEAGMVEQGVDRDRYALIVDRRSAIQEAIAKAAENDVVLIAGKGHEIVQIIEGNALHFDDREEALKAIRRIFI